MAGEAGEAPAGGRRFRKCGQVVPLNLRDAIMSLAAEDLSSPTLLPSLHHVFPKAYKEVYQDKLRTVVAEFLPRYVANKTLTMGPDKHLVKLGPTSTLRTLFLGCPFLAKVDAFQPSCLEPACASMLAWLQRGSLRKSSIFSYPLQPLMLKFPST